MADYSPEMIEGFYSVCVNGGTVHARGKALEDLVEYFFKAVPGVKIVARDQLNKYESEEVDLAIWQDKHPDGLHFLRYDFLIECKNWTTSVGSQDVLAFINKVQGRAMDFGVLITRNGISGEGVNFTASHKMVADALRDGTRIVVVRLDEIKVLKDTLSLAELMKQKLCDLAMYGTTFP